MADTLFNGNGSIIAHSAATTLPFPPVRGAGVDHWNSVAGAAPEFDVQIRSAGTVSVTAARVLSGTLAAQVIADDTVDTVDTTDNELDIASHLYLAGDGPVRISSSGTLPGGLDASTDYWVIYISSGAIALATSRANALAGTKIDLTSAGSGTITIADTVDTKRLGWDSVGLLGDAEDGAISLATTSPGYRARVNHAPTVVAYAVMATLSASNVTITITPVSDR